MLQKTQVSVQPLLDEVMSSGKEKGKVMGSVRLEDIEADVTKDNNISTVKDLSNEKKNKGIIGDGDDEMIDSHVKMEAFHRLVQKMKSSGTLPEKPQPAVRTHCVYTLPFIPYRVVLFFFFFFFFFHEYRLRCHLMSRFRWTD